MAENTHKIKPFLKVAQSFEEYRQLDAEKIERYNTLNEDVYDGMQVSYKVTDVGVARQILESPDLDDCNLVDILQTFVVYKGNIVMSKSVADVDGGKLVGVEMTHEDYYWMIEKEDKIMYVSCCFRIEFIYYE